MTLTVNSIYQAMFYFTPPPLFSQITPATHFPACILHSLLVYPDESQTWDRSNVLVTNG